MTDVNVNTTKYINSKVSNGAKTSTLKVMFPITTDDDTGKVIRFCTIPATALITKIQVGCTAITGLTDSDIGVYEAGVGGAVIDADIFMDGQTLASASKVLDGLQTVSVANSVMNIKDLVNTVASSTVISSDKYVDIAMTLKADASTTGNVSILIEYLA